jgi:hypothetical protein
MVGLERFSGGFFPSGCIRRLFHLCTIAGLVPPGGVHLAVILAPGGRISLSICLLFFPIDNRVTVWYYVGITRKG